MWSHPLLYDVKMYNDQPTYTWRSPLRTSCNENLTGSNRETKCWGDLWKNHKQPSSKVEVILQQDALPLGNEQQGPGGRRKALSSQLHKNFLLILELFHSLIAIPRPQSLQSFWQGLARLQSSNLPKNQLLMFSSISFPLPDSAPNMWQCTSQFHHHCMSALQCDNSNYLQCHQKSIQQAISLIMLCIP